MNGVRIFVGIAITLVVIMIAGTAVVGAGIFSVGRQVVQSYGDEDKVDAAADKIASFDLPEGYAADYAIEKLGLTVASYKPNDGHSHLVLAQSKIPYADLPALLNQAAPGTYDPKARMTILEKHSATIRGQETTVVISEGINHDGEAYRQLMAAFQGKGGPAMLTIEEPLSHWDQDQVDALVASIR